MQTKAFLGVSILYFVLGTIRAIQTLNIRKFHVIQTAIEITDANYKLTEKKTFEAAGIRVAPYQKVESTGDVKKFILQHNYPVVLKTIKGGYDGYGNYTIKNEADIIIAFKKLR